METNNNIEFFSLKEICEKTKMTETSARAAQKQGLLIPSNPCGQKKYTMNDIELMCQRAILKQENQQRRRRAV